MLLDILLIWVLDVFVSLNRQFPISIWPPWRIKKLSLQPAVVQPANQKLSESELIPAVRKITNTNRETHKNQKNHGYWLRL